MRQSTLITFITTLLIAASSTTLAIVAPIYGQAQAIPILQQQKMYQPADMAGENIAKTFVGGDPPALRTATLDQSSSTLTSANGTSVAVSSRSEAGGNIVAVPAWAVTIYSIVNALLPT